MSRVEVFGGLGGARVGCGDRPTISARYTAALVPGKWPNGLGRVQSRPSEPKAKRSDGGRGNSIVYGRKISHKFAKEQPISLVSSALPRRSWRPSYRTLLHTVILSVSTEQPGASTFPPTCPTAPTDPENLCPGRLRLRNDEVGHSTAGKHTPLA